MIKSEAKWLRDWILRLKPETVLNCGSSTLHFRTVEQPWIEEAFAGFDVTHLDAKNEPGVDMVCTLGDGFLADSPMLYDLVVLSSVLEHVEDRDAAFRDANFACVEMIVTVPHVWPYHPDPIDNGWRPSPKELADYVASRELVIIDAVELFDKRGSCSAVVATREGMWPRRD